MWICRIIGECTKNSCARDGEGWRGRASLRLRCWRPQPAPPTQAPSRSLMRRAPWDQHLHKQARVAAQEGAHPRRKHALQWLLRAAVNFVERGVRGDMTVLC